VDDDGNNDDDDAAAGGAPAAAGREAVDEPVAASTPCVAAATARIGLGSLFAGAAPATTSTSLPVSTNSATIASCDRERVERVDGGEVGEEDEEEEPTSPSA